MTERVIIAGHAISTRPPLFVPPGKSHRFVPTRSSANITCGPVLSVLDDTGGDYGKGKDGVAIKGLSCGETAGWRYDRKLPLLGYAVLHHSAPYVGDNCVRTRWNLALQENKPNPVIRLAPTGIAAFGINGMTVHSALSLPVKPPFNPLAPSTLSKLQHQWKDIKLLIIDEKSMIGRTMAGKMDSRLQQIIADEVMGGIGVLLFGDFAQLPPVGDSLLYSSKIPLKPLQIAGRDVYLSFNQSTTLQHIFRQQGNDPISQHFRDLLLRQRTYSITQEDYDLLSSRFSQNLPDEEKNAFRDEIHLFPKRINVEDHNHHYLESAHVPVLRCKARHTGGRSAKLATEEQADGLEAELLLAVGAKVMLTRNIWTERGIYFSPCY